MPETVLGFSHVLVPSILTIPGGVSYLLGFPGGGVVENPPVNAGGARDAGSIPGSGRFPREGNGNSLQYSCLENSMDRGT